MMHDVKIKKLKLLPDERGFLMEMLRCDDEVFKDFGQVYITGCARGIAKAWHYHKEQTDNFVCVYGRALVVLCDLRDGSPTYGVSEEYLIEGPPPTLTLPLKGGGRGGWGVRGISFSRYRRLLYTVLLPMSVMMPV